MSPSVCLPDPAFCKTRHHFADYWVCLGKGFVCSDHCPYEFKFGLNHYCRHPQRLDFSLGSQHEVRCNEM
jgi:hypothetical protein